MKNNNLNLLRRTIHAHLLLHEGYSDMVNDIQLNQIVSFIKLAFKAFRNVSNILPIITNVQFFVVWRCDEKNDDSFYKRASFDEISSTISSLEKHFEVYSQRNKVVNYEIYAGVNLFAQVGDGRYDTLFIADSRHPADSRYMSKLILCKSYEEMPLNFRQKIELYIGHSDPNLSYVVKSDIPGLEDLDLS